MQKLESQLAPITQSQKNRSFMPISEEELSKLSHQAQQKVFDEAMYLRRLEQEFDACSVWTEDLRAYV